MNNFNNMYELIVIDIGYNILVCGIIGMNKIVYIHKFPPASNTTNYPNLSQTNPHDQYKHEIESNEDFVYGYKINNKIRKDIVEKFWQSTNLYQANGDWKGGEWGSNNLPTISNNFCSEIFIGDKVMIKDIKFGIIPYNKRFSSPFESDDNIIDESEDFAWSANITNINTNLTYSCYICDCPMPQSAIDVLFVWENSLGHKFVKVLRRGISNPNVDMPCLMMPGAGEHREPGNEICFKTNALRAINEEIGISQDTLSKSYLIPIGIFNDKKRDPRYWSYTIYQDEQIITFGPERESETNVYMLYIQTDTTNEPEEIDWIDKIEVGKKHWIGMDNPILTNKELWMIPEHSTYFAHSLNVLEIFKLKSQEDKNLYKFNF